ncbi:hypothetical protein LMG28614_03468 [Paraburkholderia ultramafica]|uniref:HTH gntR-type domain-containing protein n=1 Tax=Paraburkholderia ultramafica TaxID=1544867 RepID=A0A6S7B8Z1_9BURK|nr:hypothetical protein LMG28614_03468 [Paraburkholderia ultramafica]
MARTARVAGLPAFGALDRTAGNLRRQVAEALREAVRNGDIGAGDALPATRSLAASLQVARGTVIEAYEQLIAEGFLEAKAGAGTRVAQALAGPQPVSEPRIDAGRATECGASIKVRAAAQRLAAVVAAMAKTR